MLQEAFEKLDAGDGRPFKPLRAIVAVAEGDLAIVDRFDAAVGDGDAKDITAEIFQDLITGTGMLGMNDPFFLPEGVRNVLEQMSFVQGGTHLGSEDDRKGADRNQESRIFRWHPA